MSDDPTLDDDNDDQEMLDAIAAAFGDDAIDVLGEENTAEEAPQEGDLTELVQQIDDQTFETSASASPKATVPSGSAQSVEKFVILELAETCFGIPMDNVHEIQRVPSITQLPGVPGWVLGVTNLRGNVVSVIDLQTIFGITSQDDFLQSSRRLVMTHSLIDEIDTGLIVDSVRGIRTISTASIAAPTADIDERIAPYLRGMTEVDDKLVALLDIEKFLISEEFRQFDAA